MTRGFDAVERRHLLVQALTLGHSHSRGPVQGIDGFGIPGPAPVFVGEPCTAFPIAETRRTRDFVFLREIGGPPCLVDYLNSNFPYSRERVVVIDQPCVITEELLIPAGVTLRGCGMNGPGRLVIEGAAAELTSGAIKMGSQGHASFLYPSALEDLAIEGFYVEGTGVGIRGHNKRLSRVRIAGFRTLITSSFDAENVLLDGLQLAGLDHATVGVEMRGRTWRVRNVFVRDATSWGAVVEASDVVIEAGRFESNGNPLSLAADSRGAVFVSGSDVRIIANYFEQNGYALVDLLDENGVPVLDANGDVIKVLAAVGTAVSVVDVARRVSILANFLAAEVIVFSGRSVFTPLPIPNDATMFAQDGTPAPELTAAIGDGRHTVAFNTDDDHGTNYYPHRGLMVARLATGAITFLP